MDTRYIHVYIFDEYIALLGGCIDSLFWLSCFYFLTIYIFRFLFTFKNIANGLELDSSFIKTETGTLLKGYT